MQKLPSASARPSPLEQGDGMKHRTKSSRSAKKREERREGKQHAPRDTPFPLPPTFTNTMCISPRASILRNYRPFADWQGPKVICEMKRA